MASTGEVISIRHRPCTVPLRTAPNAKVAASSQEIEFPSLPNNWSWRLLESSQLAKIKLTLAKKANFCSTQLALNWVEINGGIHIPSTTIIIESKISKKRIIQKMLVKECNEFGTLTTVPDNVRPPKGLAMEATTTNLHYLTLWVRGLMCMVLASLALFTSCFPCAASLM